LGSETEKNVKFDAAELEPAWKGVGQVEELRVWRIVDFKVTEWPKEQYGEFFEGDTYIVFKSTKN